MTVTRSRFRELELQYEAGLAHDMYDLEEDELRKLRHERKTLEQAELDEVFNKAGIVPNER